MDWITIATIVSAGATATAAWIAWEHLKHEKTSNQTTRHIAAAPIPAPPAFPTTYGATSNASLESEVGADYSTLRKLLAAQRFKEADQETWRMMLWVAARENEGWFRNEDIEQFPCRDLQTIDRLWVQHSNGRFGFSVQKRIYNEVGKDFVKLADRVGWRRGEEWLKYEDYKFELRAPVGHLPRGRGGGWVDGGDWVFFSRVETCRL
ncbi:GUN4 domain-containing protein [Spirulina major CS-329]|uniref:GUN4 domain-containing protein n=1 Tax=Spirulina TaxID=1154 RepID=UPI00233002A2|nr:MULTISPECIES: GUN4 domain-containing protein [Spirulina]MDB9496343.1 GUN4 domain-containing protein [Spirulina subsalsa CS-330]MDB9502779.1 GUN4 domain-containing protein [Spirulina major CS-329]